jgi:dihydropteroate synthase
MAFVRRPIAAWQLRTRSFELGARTLVMGVVNVTPDSFSDGGLFFSADAATAQALALLDQGADIIDIGGESTRPGLADLTVSTQEEQDRILPVLSAVLRERPPAVLSVDTYKAATARAAVAAGAEIVNDISGLAWDAEMAATCAQLACGVVLTHTRGRPSEWPSLPRLAPSAVVPLVRSGLAQSLDRAVEAGIDRRRIVLDAGYGFGKIFSENHPLLAHQDDLLSLGQPLLAGVSRKSFLGRILKTALDVIEVPASERGNATLAATTAAILAGASIVRVHDLRPAREAAAVADAILAAL